MKGWGWGQGGQAAHVAENDCGSACGAAAVGHRYLTGHGLRVFHGPSNRFLWVTGIDITGLR